MGVRGERLPITKVSRAAFDGIINPVTASGTLLVADADGGAPVLAATHPASVAPFFLATRVFDTSLLGLVSTALPASTQACYEALEPLVVDPLLAPALAASGLGGAGSWISAASFAVADGLFALSLIAFALLSFACINTLGVAAASCCLAVTVAKK